MSITSDATIERVEGSFLGQPPVRLTITTVYNAPDKIDHPRYGGSLWEMMLSIPTGDGHDQEQDSDGKWAQGSTESA